MMYNSFSAQNLSSLSLFKWAGEPPWNIIWVNIVLYALKILKLGRGSKHRHSTIQARAVPSQPEACLSSRIQCWQLWLTRAKGGAMRIPWCSHVKANRLSRWNTLTQEDTDCAAQGRLLRGWVGRCRVRPRMRLQRALRTAPMFSGLRRMERARGQSRTISATVSSMAPVYKEVASSPCDFEFG